MKLKHLCGRSESEQEEALAMYALACLNEMSTLPAGDANDDVRSCPACLAEAAAVLTWLRWREAEVPFNRHALPLPDLTRVIGPRQKEKIR